MIIANSGEGAFVKLARSTTPLLAGAEYAMPAALVTPYSYLRGSILADQDGIVYVEASDDGISWTGALDPRAYTALDKLTFKVPVTGVYSRFRFANGVVDQGSFFFVVYGSTQK